MRAVRLTSSPLCLSFDRRRASISGETNGTPPRRCVDYWSRSHNTNCLLLHSHTICCAIFAIKEVLCFSKQRSVLALQQLFNVGPPPQLLRMTCSAAAFRPTHVMATSSTTHNR